MQYATLTGVLVVVSLTLGSIAQAFDSSDYRQTTYGPPTRYCNPTRALNSNGAGTLNDPWNMAQCAALPVAGDVVGIMPGISVRLPTTNSVRVPAFNVANSGTANSRIVFVTKYAAVALANVETNPNRSEFRHDGSAPTIIEGHGNLADTGAPMLGAYGRSYLTFDGFYIDMAQAYLREDSGVLRAEDCVGVHFKNFVIKGATLTIASNAVVYRPNNAVDTVLRNFRVYDFVNDSTGSTTPQPSLFSDQYGDLNVTIEHFEMSNLGMGIFFKGSAAQNTAWNYGTIRYGIVKNVSVCFRFNAMDATHVTELAYNLCYDVRDTGGITLSSETSPVRNLFIHHNTVARVDGTNINTSGGIYSRAYGIGDNVSIRDNLVDITPGPFGRPVDFGEIATLPALLNYNGYYKGGAAMIWGYNGVEYNSMTSWRAGSNRDANSVVLSSSPFVNSSGADFHVAPGHAAKTASSSGGELGAYAGAEVPGVELGTSARRPAAPNNLRVLP